MRNALFAAALSGALSFASPAAADVRLTINNGQVTLSAKDATIRQILAEWARIGQTKIVNADRVVGSQVTLELANVSEEQALDVVLRSVSGYLAAPRAVTVTNASRYDRILLLPTSTGTRPSATPAPTFQQPQFNPQRADDVDDADDEPGPPGAAPMPRGPIFNAFPPGQGAQRGRPTQQATPTEAPQPASPGIFSTPAMPPGVTMSPGVAVPGMVVPSAAQPGAAPAPEAAAETP